MNKFTLTSASTVSVGLGALLLVTGGLGVADAASGGGLLLGHKNTATATTTLSDKKGTPLSLHAPASKAPLAVNSKHEVANLNSQYLDGYTATSLAPKTTQVIGQLAAGDFGGAVLCPSGTHPEGGGELPDVTNVDDTDTFTVNISFPDISSAGVFDGWDAFSSDSDGSWDGSGYLFVECESGSESVGAADVAAAAAKQGALHQLMRATRARFARSHH